jgi:sugar/nucleoside kinase (ribokinase family)
MGVVTRLCARIGADLFGRAVVDLLERAAPGSTSELAVVPDEVTSYSVVLSPPGQDRGFLHHPGANDRFSAADVPDAALDGADLLHFGYPPVMQRMAANQGQELLDLFRRSQERGLLTSLDLCMIDPEGQAEPVDWDATLGAVLPAVDCFVPSAGELLAMWDWPRYQELARSGDVCKGLTGAEIRGLAARALQAGPSVVALKLGTRGIYLRTSADAGRLLQGRGDGSSWSNRELWAPAFAAERVVTTTGAGDAAVAGLLAALLRGATPEDALVMACAAGACAVEAAGATEGVQDWETTGQRIEAGWPQLRLQPDAENWTQDAEGGIWYGPQD